MIKQSLTSADIFGAKPYSEEIQVSKWCRNFDLAASLSHSPKNSSIPMLKTFFFLFTIFKTFNSDEHSVCSDSSPKMQHSFLTVNHNPK